MVLGIQLSKLLNNVIQLPPDMRFLPHQPHYCSCWKTMVVRILPVIVVLNVIC